MSESKKMEINVYDGGQVNIAKDNGNIYSTTNLYEIKNRNFNKIPMQCKEFCSEPNILIAIEKHFNNKNQICVLYGLSGSGKTQASINYVHSKKNEFRNYIWITGDDWKKDTLLSSIQRTSTGTPINIVGMFNKSKSILIIDSIERVIEKEFFDELKPGFEMGGVVLATSQIADSTKEYYLAMPPISEKVALKILGETTESMFLTKEIIEKCKYSPLVLSTIRKMVEMENVNRKELYMEILDDPKEISETDGSSIISKVLDKLQSKTHENLKKIANTGLTVFDIEFLRKFTSNLSCHKLQQLSIIMPTNIPNVVKVHDLICLALKDETNCYSIIADIREFIAGTKGEMTPSVLRQIHLARNVISKYKEQHKELDWLTYAMLQIEGVEKNELVNDFFDKEFEDNMTLSVVMCIIEIKELYGYMLDKKEERKAYYKKCIDQYKKAIDLYQDVDRKAELLHHLGKALRRNEQYEESYKIFEELLVLKPEWHATYGQIVTLGTLKKSNELKQAGEKYMKLLLLDMLKDASKVPLRVSLAAIARLRSYMNVVNEMVNNEEKVKKISLIVKNAALEDIGQFFEAFVAITSIFSYHYSQICVELAESVPEMILVTPEMIEERQWINACEALVNLSSSADKEQKKEISSMLLQKGIEFADRISKKDNLNAYCTRAIAKAYIRNGEYNKAIDVINNLPENKQDHWILYRKAEAEMFLYKKQAVDTAKRAYELLLNDKMNINREASYIDLISKCYEKLQDYKCAIDELEKAIKKCYDKKYKNELIERKNCLENYI